MQIIGKIAKYNDNILINTMFIYLFKYIDNFDT